MAEAVAEKQKQWMILEKNFEKSIALPSKKKKKLNVQKRKVWKTQNKRNGGSFCN